MPQQLTIRPDLLAAQAAAWRQVTSPGASFGGGERSAIAAVALAALDDPAPLPPWVSPTQAGRTLPGVPAEPALPALVVDATYRIARHASSLSEDWYHDVIARGLAPIAYVELVGIVSAVAAVDGFYRAAGLPRPPLPAITEGEPHRQHPHVEKATLNWVPVAAPADRTASVVQALSALPDEYDNMWRLAESQYMSNEQMDDPRWTRGTLSRPQMELVAGRLSLIRECFF